MVVKQPVTTKSGIYRVLAAILNLNRKDGFTLTEVSHESQKEIGYVKEVISHFEATESFTVAGIERFRILPYCVCPVADLLEIIKLSEELARKNRRRTHAPTL